MISQEIGWNKEKDSLYKKIEDLISQNAILIQNSKKNNEKVFNLERQVEIQTRQLEAETIVWNEGKKILLKQIHDHHTTAEKNVLIHNSNETEATLQHQITDLYKMQKILYDELGNVGKKFNNLGRGLQDLEKNLPLDGNPITDSPLLNTIDKLSPTMKLIIAPKGRVTGDELGSLMGSFVSLTAYIVTRANSNMKITALSGVATLCSQVIGTMFNNVVSHISTVKNPGLKSCAIKAVTNVPWIIVGGVPPIVTGGFIPSWKLRAIVTAVVTFIIKVVFAVVWADLYDIPMSQAFCLVVSGMIGIALSAGAPDLLALLAKKSDH